MELQKKIEELGSAFEQFKKANDAQLAEIKTKGYASAETTEKVEKLNGAITSLEEKIEAMQKAFNRSPQGSENPEAKEKAEKAEYRDAFLKFMRKGLPATEEMKALARKYMSVDSDEDGGFFVTPEMSSEVVKKVFESSPVRQLASVQTISSDSLEIIEDLDEVSSGWVGESQTRSETNTAQIKKIVIPVHELHAQPKTTQKVLDDAAVNLEQWLSGKVSEKFARDEATAFISGNGVLKPKGILDYADGTGFGQIERKQTAANNAITADEIIDTQTALKEAYQINATWLINRSIIGYIRKLKDIANGNYLWQPGLTVGQPGQLLGRPVMMAADLPSTVTASTDTIIYGDFRAGYQVVDRIGIRVLRDPYTAKGFVLFYTTKRVGGGVKNFEALKVLKVKA